MAIINHQEVLVDSSTTQKGDGLRYYLTKDSKASELFEIYQKNNKPNITTPIITSAGTAMVLSGLLVSRNSANFINNRNLIGAGFTLLVLNYFISKTSQHRNEKNLNEAIYQYNLRQTPKIYFTPVTGENLFPSSTNSLNMLDNNSLRVSGAEIGWIKRF